MLQIAAVKAWMGDPEGALDIVEEQIGEEEVSHPFHSQYFMCRKSLGQATARAGDFVTAERLADRQAIDPIRRRRLLGQVLDYSDSENSIVISSGKNSDRLFASPRKLTDSGGFASFYQAENHALSFLEQVALGEDIHANVRAFYRRYTKRYTR